MTRLPSGGREGKPPTWPLLDDVALKARHSVLSAKAERLRYQLDEAEPGPRRARLERQVDELDIEVETIALQLAEQRKLERALWRELWKTPQACAWERLGWTRDVAQYVRWKVLAELGSLEAAKEARQLSDRIGLTPLAMLRLRWEIAADEVAEQRQERPAATGRPSARQRMRVVDSSAVAGS
ncbi:hypothetical protein [Streptomyces sp. NPDC057253]|uniref:hypothetical protein n=1 Tax=Streptomyces sp. NPDC057253 TaxID=3346069 RepID=UPI00363AF0C1